jgi:hypothetical protein
VQSSLSVLEPSESFSLLTLEQAKLGLNLAKSTDKTLDSQIEMLVEWSSDEIAVMCNRVFAKEKVKETFSGDSFDNRIFLSRWPVSPTDIETVTELGVGSTIDVDFALDPASGTLFRIGDTWGSTVEITYSGGYKLPNESPRALRQATLLMMREAYNAAIRGDSTIRMVGHKESRVLYFDPNAKSGAAGGAAGGGGSPSRRAIGDLLKHYMRFWV